MNIFIAVYTTHEPKKRGRKMIQLDSGIENQLYAFDDLENILKRLGFVIGGNWDYDHADFDYKIESDEVFSHIQANVCIRLNHFSISSMKG